MGARGRKSTAQLAVVSSTPQPIESTRRAEPPVDLNDEQAEIWRTVVNTMPADWFPPSTHPLLASYCRHVATQRRIGSLIAAVEAGDDLDLKDYDRLLKCQERESRCIASLAVKMRIAQSTAYDKSQKRPHEADKPWQATLDF